MQECFRAHPDVYGAELDEDEDEDKPEIQNGLLEQKSAADLDSQTPAPLDKDLNAENKGVLRTV